MAIDRIYFKEKNFVLTLIYDKLTDIELINHVHAMNTEYEGIYGIKELADCRYLYDISELTARDMLTTADAEKESTRVILGKGAIVAETDGIFGLASMYAAIASNIREDSKVFRSLDEAIDFLELGEFKSKLIEQLSESAYEERFSSLNKSILK
ncbi:MAG: hypothetical protein KAS21_04175 [Candidatus Aminicenantes bacterium]|nr:hypothetical protein [Candidatus Aminicenantes bacterium]